MKKRFSSIITCLVALVLVVVMASGCSFVDKNTGMRSASTGVDSSVAAQQVDFETTAVERNSLDALQTAVAKVERTSVMIEIGATSAGSGVIVDISFDDEGDDVASWKKNDNVIYIITCHHMVSRENTFGTEGVGEITVYIPDENCDYSNEDYIFSGFIGNGKPSEYESTGYAVTLVGGDYESDIALLKVNLSIPAKSGKTLSADKIVKAQIPDFSSGYQTRKGETVFSIGNPTGTLPGTVASGIVSYLNRETSVSEVGNMTLMQIDVSTNPGSSGGGLYNLYGELIGITNAGNTNYTNINFAIPCHLDNGNGFVDVVAGLGGPATENNYGYVSGRRVKFGFTVTQGSDSDGSFVYVSAVTSGSIAASSGLQANDVITTITVKNGSEVVATKDVTTVTQFGEIMNKLQAGYQVVLDGTRTTTSWGRTKTSSLKVTMIAESFLFCNTGY